MALAALFAVAFAFNAATLVVVSLIVKRELPARDVVLASVVAAVSTTATLALVTVLHE